MKQAETKETVCRVQIDDTGIVSIVERNAENIFGDIIRVHSFDASGYGSLICLIRFSQWAWEFVLLFVLMWLCSRFCAAKD